MRKNLLRFLVPVTGVASLAASHLARAQDTSLDQVSPTSTAEAQVLTPDVYERTWNVSPRAGVLGYQDGNLNYASRFLLGFTTNVNLASVAPMPNPWNVGFETGLLFSHTGAPGSNFIGSEYVAPMGVFGSLGGANTYFVPMNLSLGYRVADNLLLALIAGPQLVFRSVPSAMHFGRSSDTSPSNSIDFFPGVGANVGYVLNKQIALSLRGEFIPTPSMGMFTTTLGATIGLA